MKVFLRLIPALFVTAACLLQAPLWAGDKKDPDKKDPDKKPDPAKDVVVKDSLNNADLKDKVRTQMYCKTYTFKMIEGRNYQLDMIGDFDSYLRLENPEGAQVAADDDSGGFPHARIVYLAPKTGDYTIICTTYAAGATGKYTLIVKDLTVGRAPKEKEKEEKKDKTGQAAPLGPNSAPEIGASIIALRPQAGR